MVELSRTVSGPVVGSYIVQDKTQQAELDPGTIVEDELFAVEAWEPCMVCGTANDAHESMYCDGCDKAVHVFCSGYEESPEVWYCEACLADMERDTGLQGIASAVRRRPQRRQPAPQGRGRRTNDAIWARVWQEVSHRIDLDLDFPFDDELSDRRTEEQRREFAAWQRRLEEAGRQGTASRLRGIAAARPQRPDATPPVDPESQEEIRAWNAFDKARESQEAPQAVRRHKRKATASPASPREAESSEARQLKRPRLRRPPAAFEEPQVAESSHDAVQRGEDKSTFLTSLLKDVENKPVSASSPDASEQCNGQFSPRNSSPARSPTSSGYATPRALSVTPPPQRPMSPPLSSTAGPISSPAIPTFSPCSPAELSQAADISTGLYQQGRQRRAYNSPDSDREGALKTEASPASPSRTLSYSAKEEIQRMVKLALSSRYRDKEINKEQYTDINRDVSRKLYNMVRNASALADQAEREKFQDVAEEEVRKALALLAGAPVSVNLG